MNSYVKLFITAAIHLVLMFLLTYAAINSFDDFYVNINRMYMALLMVSPMLIIMTIAMGNMYKNTTANAAIIIGSLVVFVGAFSAIRSQAGVGNVQFLRSMIPHHSSAIVMCEHSDITDPEILELCTEIVEAQEREINQMNEILDRL